MRDSEPGVTFMPPLGPGRNTDGGGGAGGETPQNFRILLYFDNKIWRKTNNYKLCV